MRTLSDKPVKLPKTARYIADYRNPRDGSKVLLQVRATKAKVYVRTDETYPEWVLAEQEEATYLMERAQEIWDNAGRMSRVRRFVEQARDARMKWENAAERRQLLGLIEEAALRAWLRAETPEARMAVNDEKERILDAIELAAEYDEEPPKLPEAWEILPPNPTKSQYKLRF